MKTIEIIGFKRANLGKAESKKLRLETNIPCVLYGGKEQVHFSVPEVLFRSLVYTPQANIVKLTVGKQSYDAILQDIQFHPVHEQIVHVDFLELVPGKEVKMNIPVKFVGAAPGVLKGGKLIQKLKKIAVKATADKLPDYIEVDVSGLELNKTIKVGDIKANGYVILLAKSIPVASVEVPRALKVEDETPAAAAAPAAAPAAAAAPAKK